MSNIKDRDRVDQLSQYLVDGDGDYVTGTKLPSNVSLYDILAGANGIPTTFPASALPAAGISMVEVLREAYDQGEKAVATSAAVMSDALTVFTIAGGPIELLNILAVCVTGNDATASTLLFYADPTDGAATDLCAASGTLASLAAGNIVNITGTLATGAVITTTGTAISQAGKIVVPVGIIALTVGTGSTTGTWTINMRYKPLARGVTVTAAY